MTPWEYEPLRTDRLLLRLMVDDDLDDVLAWMSDETVTRYQLYDVRSREQVQEHIDKVKDARHLEKADDFVEFAIELDGTVIGCIYFALKSPENQTAEIGWALTAAHQGKGYAYESAHAVMALAFETMGLHRVVAELDPRNAPSIALCRKLGLREEALHVEDLWFKGAWADTGIYAILDREWRALSA